MVHLLNYLPEKRGEMLIVEEALQAFNVKIKLRLDGRKVKRLYLAPKEKELAFERNGDHLLFTIPEFRGYVLAVAEFEDN